MSEEQIIASPMTEADGPDFKIIELLFFAYRDFVSDADVVLEEYGFGRAHHRVLHFVNRNPGLTVAHLLEILGITKQSLGRVLRQLVASGHIVQRPGPADKRQRLLYPTQNGRNLALKLSEIQTKRIKNAAQGKNRKIDPAIATFLTNMVGPSGQQRMNELSGNIKSAKSVSPAADAATDLSAKGS